MSVRGLLIKCIQCFRIVLDIPSYPVELFDFSDLSIVFTSVSVTGIIFICVMLSVFYFLVIVRLCADRFVWCLY